jgi:hypothetical protein
MSAEIGKIISKLSQQWLGFEGVEGIGQSKIDNTDCILVFISQETEEIRSNIPEDFEGIPVRLFNTGKIDIEDN